MSQRHAEANAARIEALARVEEVETQVVTAQVRPFHLIGGHICTGGVKSLIISVWYSVSILFFVTHKPGAIQLRNIRVL